LTADPQRTALAERLAVLSNRLAEWIDPFLISIGWMFGMVFFTFGLAPIFEGEGGNVELLALGTALLALSRAAVAGAYARRHRCRCGEAGPKSPRS
jgi:hypothetical protein